MTDHHGEEVFLACLIGQQLQRHQYEGRVNALIAAGYPMSEARAIIKAWYALHHCPRWYPLCWQTAAAFCALGVLNSLSPRFYAGALGCAGAASLCLLRARYCTNANIRARATAARARSTLARYGQL